MRKSKFEDQITSSLKQATPDILDKIKSSNQFYVPDKEKKFDFNRIFNKRLSYSLASIFVLALILFSVLSSGTDLPEVVASTVTIDINPSVEITLDENDNVINILAINTEGELLIDRDIKFKGLTLERTIEIIIAEAIRRGYIDDDFEDNIILIDVSSERSFIKARVEAALENKINQEMAKVSKAVRVERENREELTENQVTNLQNIAKNNRISLAKLHLINKIIEADSSYTVEELKGLTIRNLYLILSEVLPEDDTTRGNNDSNGNN